MYTSTHNLYSTNNRYIHVQCTYLDGYILILCNVFFRGLYNFFCGKNVTYINPSNKSMVGRCSLIACHLVPRKTFSSSFVKSGPHENLPLYGSDCCQPHGSRDISSIIVVNRVICMEQPNTPVVLWLYISLQYTGHRVPSY